MELIAGPFLVVGLDPLQVHGTSERHVSRPPSSIVHLRDGSLFHFEGRRLL